MQRFSIHRSLSPPPDRRKELERIRSHPRNNYPDWVTEWEYHSSNGSPYSSQENQSSILSLKQRSGWTSPLANSSFDSYPFRLKREPEGKSEVTRLKEKLTKLREENSRARDYIVTEVREIMKERKIFTGDDSWTTLDVPQIEEELDFRVKVIEILRTTLSKYKARGLKIKGPIQSDSKGYKIHDSSKSMDSSSALVSVQKEVGELESHLKLLNDAIDDEKQENYELAKENTLLHKRLA